MKRAKIWFWRTGSLDLSCKTPVEKSLPIMRSSPLLYPRLGTVQGWVWTPTYFRSVWLVFVLLNCTLASFLRAQDSVRAEVKNFVAPMSDDDGNKTVIRGESGRMLENGLYDLGGIVVETYRGEEKDMIVEANQCFFDSAMRIAYSAEELTVRAANERFSITGKGFLWEGASSSLVISNSVQTLLRKQEFEAQSDETTERLSTRGSLDKASGNKAGSDERIEIRSNGLNLKGNYAVFTGDVLARDRNAEMFCDKLTAEMGASGRGVRRIVAEENVAYSDDAVRTTGERAVYSVADETATLTGNVGWKIEENEGTSDLIEVHNGLREFRARKNVSVTVAAEKFVPSGWFSNAPQPPPGDTDPRAFEILADDLEYRSDSAAFRGNVRVQDGESSVFRCDVLISEFSGNDGKLTNLHAEGNVQFQQNDALIQGDRADYSESENVMTLSGSPEWTIAEGTGSSDLLIFDPENNRIQADGHVTMKFKVKSDLLPDFSFKPEEKSENRVLPGTDVEIQVDSQKMYYQPGSAIFLNRVRLMLPSEMQQTLSSEVLAVFFSGPDNRLDQLVAEERVVLRQPGLQAFCGKVNHRVDTGVTVLTGNPRILTDDRKYSADEFRLEDSGNLFRMKGNYLIEMKQEEILKKNDEPARDSGPG